tara:strand:+ start:684 stop:1109 length:426 start_codon:yes stop_codon:yes gene_type:complete
MENKKIIIEIPHQRSARAWVSYNDDDIINHAVNEGYWYELWTKEKAIDFYGEEDAIPDHILSELKENDEIVQVCLHDGHEGDFYKKNEAPTKLEGAEECLSRGLRSCYFLTVQEAKEFINEYRDHKSHEAIEALKEALKDI